MTLFTDAQGWLATDQRVFSRDERQHVQSAAQQVDLLSKMIAEQQELIAAASLAGHAKGFAQGLDEAAEQSRKALDVQQLALELRYAEAESELRAAAVPLALEVVRKVAGQVAPAVWLLATAEHAAGELYDASCVTLHVHPEQLEALTEHWRDAATSSVHAVSSDDSLTMNGCVLETPRGLIEVDLDTQLDLITRLLAGDP